MLTLSHGNASMCDCSNLGNLIRLGSSRSTVGDCLCFSPGGESITRHGLCIKITTSSAQLGGIPDVPPVDVDAPPSIPSRAQVSLAHVIQRFRGEGRSHRPRAGFGSSGKGECGSLWTSVSTIR